MLSEEKRAELSAELEAAQMRLMHVETEVRQKYKDEIALLQEAAQQGGSSEEDQARIQELEEQLQQQADEMEETDDRCSFSPFM